MTYIMKNFRTYQLAVDFYKQCQKVEIGEPIKSQFQRATLSVVLNLAEVTGKLTPKDKRKFYFYLTGCWANIMLGNLMDTQHIKSLI